MKIQNCIQYGMRHIYNRKGLFLLSIIIIGVSIVLLFDVFGIYFACNEQVENGREMFRYDRNHIYKISLEATSDDFAYYERLNKCMKELNKSLKLGLYTYDNIEISNLNPDDVEPILEEIHREGGIPGGTGYLYNFNITNEMLDMCEIMDEDGNIVQLGRQGEYIEVAIGKNFADLLPIGTKFRDNLYGQNYIVTCVLKEGQIWRGGELYYCHTSNYNSYLS